MYFPYRSVKVRIKKVFKNEFSTLSGIEAILMLGGSECLVSRVAYLKNHYPIQKYAWGLYNGVEKPGANIRVETICKVKNCVRKEHLKAKFYPTYDEREYMENWGRGFEPSYYAFKYNVPVQCIKDYMDDNFVKRNPQK